MPYKIPPANPKRMRLNPVGQENKLEKQDFYIVPDGKGGYIRKRKGSLKKLFGLE